MGPESKKAERARLEQLQSDVDRANEMSEDRELRLLSEELWKSSVREEYEYINGNIKLGLPVWPTTYIYIYIYIYIYAYTYICIYKQHKYIYKYMHI